MSEEHLIKLCQQLSARFKLHWVSEIYGFGVIIRRYGFYPRIFPLNIYLSHGITVGEKAAPHELHNSAPYMFYFSPRLVKAFQKVSLKPCYCLLSPNVYYRRSRKIVQNENARGTIAFLAHTTNQIEDKMDMVGYANQLKALPEKYQPVTVCLHYHDVNKGVHKIFHNEGFDVVTVGSPFHDSFIERFYEIVKDFRYITSNEIGSYTFYGPEMGIPFFLYGNEPDLHNHADPNIELGKYDSYKKTNQYKKVQRLFRTPTDEVTPEQRAFVEEELGVYDSITRFKMMRLLYHSYFLFLWKEFKIRTYSILKFKWIKSLLKRRKVDQQRLALYYKNYKRFGYSFAKSFFLNRRRKTVKLFGKDFSYANEFWFLHSVQEIVNDKTYWFNADTSKPIIIDCGANIGLSVIYFKQLYKDAQVIAFEPDPLNFALLSKNVSSFGVNDVQLNNKAVWSSNTVLEFSSSRSSVGSMLSLNTNHSGNVKVEAVPLSDILKNKVIDFLKIDIEGAEDEVILSCKNYLNNVKNLFIEYHTFPGKPQRLHEILDIITKAGFRYYMKESWENLKHPYVDRNCDTYDLQLNIFAYRPYDGTSIN